MCAEQVDPGQNCRGAVCWAEFSDVCRGPHGLLYLLPEVWYAFTKSESFQPFLRLDPFSNDRGSRVQVGDNG